MKEELSDSEEEYLETLYNLTKDSERIRISEVANDIGVKEPSAVQMLKKLEEKGLVDYEKYSGVLLTEDGKREGMLVTRRHRLAERLLSDVLNRGLSKVHEEACRLEHSIADETADEIARFLENPDTCPHGHPIPDEKDKVEEEDFMKLTEGEEGEEYEVVEIPEREEDIQRLLPLAVLPGSKLKLEDKSSVGAMMIKKGQDRLALSRDIGSKIMVKPYGKRRRRRHRDRSGR